MEFENTFLVQAPVAEVWDLLLDVERVAPCMPGAQVLEHTGEDAYKVAVKVKLGPMTMNYKGDVEIVEQDAGAHRATMRAKAKEARGQGTASADVVMSLSEQADGTQASIVTSLQMSGKAAAMGQGVIKDVASALTDTFAQNLAGLVGGGAAEEPAAGVAPEAAAGAAAPEAAAGAAGAAGAGATAGGPAEPERAFPGAAPEASLPMGRIAGAVVMGRLQDPRTAGALAVVLFLLGVLVGRRSRS